MVCFLEKKNIGLFSLSVGRIRLLARHCNNICTVYATGQKYELNAGKPNGHTKRSNFGFLQFY